MECYVTEFTGLLEVDTQIALELIGIGIGAVAAILGWEHLVQLRGLRDNWQRKDTPEN